MNFIEDRSTPPLPYAPPPPRTYSPLFRYLSTKFRVCNKGMCSRREDCQQYATMMTIMQRTYGFAIKLRCIFGYNFPGHGTNGRFETRTPQPNRITYMQSSSKRTFCLPCHFPCKYRGLNVLNFHRAHVKS